MSQLHETVGLSLSGEDNYWTGCLGRYRQFIFQQLQSHAMTDDSGLVVSFLMGPRSDRVFIQGMQRVLLGRGVPH